jgi:tetraacyldisaccharide 4'-kinase
LTTVGPVIVSRDRVAGARLAREQGASVIVMDDGFQNPSLNKHLALIVVDGARGIGNGAVFPAGPLRAPLAPQIERTGVLVVVGDGTAARSLVDAVTARGGLVLRARLEAGDSSVAALRGKRVLAFAGIGDPMRFFETLRTHGIDVAATRSFPDHHVYRDVEIAALAAAAEHEQLTLVTTEKDLVRLRARGGVRPAGPIQGFGVTLMFDDELKLRQRLLQTIVAARHTAADASA